VNHLTHQDILDFLDGTMTRERRAECERHLQTCPRCREEVALQKFIAQSLKGQELVRPSASFTRSVMQAVLAAPKEETLWQKILNNLGLIFIAVIFLGTSGIAFLQKAPASAAPTPTQRVANEVLSQVSNSVAQIADMIGTGNLKIFVIAFCAVSLLYLADKFFQKKLTLKV
jgi:anti-sigma factor RsiW